MKPTVASAVLHGHFYQPPREDPWTGLVPLQPSAAPYHDWNQRIEEECYRALTRASPHGSETDGTGAKVVNVFEWMSFDLGPTLLTWLEREAPVTHRAIVEADRVARTRTGGHGNAVAMAYHHPILPLSSPRDRRSEIRWGVTDFRRRFGREPVGMWLPETAVDDETLDALAVEGIRFTILAPHQVEGAPESGLPGRYRTRAGREIAIFAYDGGLSHGVAFGELIHDVDRWERAMTPGDGRRLVSFATDGETFGHHHKAGVTALATLIRRLRARPDIAIRNFESVLAAHPPDRDVRLLEPSSWSCAHGVERWRTECGCKLAPETPSQQAWRAPLRDAVTRLADALHEIYETEGGRLLADAWGARDRYGSVVGGSDEEIESFLERELADGLDEADRARARELLEIEHNALRLFTSCAWFFDDLARVEPIQVLTYAARAIELVGERGLELEGDFLKRLEDARSNDPEEGNGRMVYESHVRKSGGVGA